VPIGRKVAGVLYQLWIRRQGHPLPDDLRELICETACLLESLEPAAKVVLDIERRAVDGWPPTTLDSKSALLALSMIANGSLYEDAYDWNLKVNQNEECRDAIRKRERRPRLFGRGSKY
jgi:hypothetical protein